MIYEDSLDLAKRGIRLRILREESQHTESGPYEITETLQWQFADDADGDDKDYWREVETEVVRTNWRGEPA